MYKISSTLELAHAFYNNRKYNKAKVLYDQQISIIRRKNICGIRLEEDKFKLAEAYYGLGGCCYRLKQYQNAIISHKLAIKNYPKVSQLAYLEIINSNYEIISEKIRNLPQTSNILAPFYKCSILFCDKAIWFFPVCAELYHKRAEMYEQLFLVCIPGKFRDKYLRQALQDFTSMIKVNPRHEFILNGQIYQEMGLIHDRLREYDHAIQNLVKVIRIPIKGQNDISRHLSAYEDLIRCSGKTNDPLKAIYYFGKAKKLIRYAQTLGLNCGHNSFAIDTFLEYIGSVEKLKNKIFLKDISKW